MIPALLSTVSGVPNEEQTAIGKAKFDVTYWKAHMRMRMRIDNNSLL